MFGLSGGYFSLLNISHWNCEHTRERCLSAVAQQILTKQKSTLHGTLSKPLTSETAYLTTLRATKTSRPDTTQPAHLAARAKLCAARARVSAACQPSTTSARRLGVAASPHRAATRRTVRPAPPTAVPPAAAPTTRPAGERGRARSAAAAAARRGRSRHELSPSPGRLSTHALIARRWASTRQREPSAVGTM